MNNQKPFNVGDKCFIVGEHSVSEEQTVAKKYKNGNVVLVGDKTRQQYDGDFGTATGGDGWHFTRLQHPGHPSIERIRFSSMVKSFKYELGNMSRKDISLGDHNTIAKKIKVVSDALEELRIHCK